MSIDFDLSDDVEYHHGQRLIYGLNKKELGYNLLLNCAKKGNAFAMYQVGYLNEYTNFMNKSQFRFEEAFFYYLNVALLDESIKTNLIRLKLIDDIDIIKKEDIARLEEEKVKDIIASSIQACNRLLNEKTISFSSLNKHEIARYKQIFKTGVKVDAPINKGFDLIEFINHLSESNIEIYSKVQVISYSFYESKIKPITNFAKDYYKEYEIYLNDVRILNKAQLDLFFENMSLEMSVLVTCFKIANFKLAQLQFKDAKANIGFELGSLLVKKKDKNLHPLADFQGLNLDVRNIDDWLALKKNKSLETIKKYFKIKEHGRMNL
jgi:hypothetical protein